MGREVTPFAQWLESKGITLTDYANRPVVDKRRLEDEYDSETWRVNSEAAAVEAAQVPRDFYIWLKGAHQMGKEAFERLSPGEANKLANEHHYALSAAQKVVDAAKQKPVVLPPELKDASPRQQLDWINKQDLIAKGYVRE